MAIVDLTKCPGTRAKVSITAGMDDYNPNPLGHFLYLEAQGCDIYVALGPTFASLASLSATAVSTVNGTDGTPTQVAGGSFCIPQGKGGPVAACRRAKGNSNNLQILALFSPARFLGWDHRRRRDERNTSNIPVKSPEIVMHFIYVDYTPDAPRPFYVGKGSPDRIARARSRSTNELPDGLPVRAVLACGPWAVSGGRVSNQHRREQRLGALPG